MSAQADELDALRGETIRIINGGGPGTTSDKYGRAFAEALEKLLPESTVAVQSVEGAGGLLAVTTMAEATGNLVSVAVFNSAPIYGQLIGSEAAGFDLSTLKWIGSLSNEQRVLGVRPTFADSYAKLKTAERQPIMPVGSSGTIADIEGKILNAISGTRIRIVTGISSDQRNAMLMAGDVDLLMGPYSRILSMIESKDITPILRYSREGYPAELDGVPTIADVAMPGTPPEVLDVMAAFNDLGQLMAAAPATSPEKTAALQAAFARIVSNPDYQAELARQRLVSVPVEGPKLAERIGGFLDASTSLTKTLGELVECGGRISEGLSTSCD